MKTEWNLPAKAKHSRSSRISIERIGANVARKVDAMPEGYVLSGRAALAFEFFNGHRRFMESQGRAMSSAESTGFYRRLKRRNIRVVKLAGQVVTFITNRIPKTFRKVV